ncbi:MAG: flagellar basal body-associated FliL family protein [Oscillospiraceae bacterium]|jgi:flagellar basal body-associated protein FliL|nr:flagellar basal body-associated FliL family protein [Oscillospiraceae bacterium]
MKKMAPIIIALIIVAAGALYFFVIRGMGGNETVEVPISTASYNAGTFTTNIKGSTRYLKCTVVLTVEDSNPEKVIERFAADVSLLRQTVTFALSSLEESQLRVVDEDQENIDAARQHVIDAVNEAFGITRVTGALFTDYVIS